MGSWIAYSQSEAQPLGAQPLGAQPSPWGLARAASKVADFAAFDHSGAGALTKLRSARQVMIVTSFILRTISIYALRLSFETRKEFYSTVQYILAFASCFAVLHLLEAMSQSEDVSVRTRSPQAWPSP